jgi:hypothetical protein
MRVSNQKKLNLEVHTEDASAEVFVIDGHFKVAERGRGLYNTFSLDPGIYTIKVRAGFESREQNVVLLDGPLQVKVPRIHFASPAPLAQTGKTHEYHIGAAFAESRQVHVKKGAGSSVFVFVRDWTSQRRADAGKEPSRRPQAGLKLLDAEGNLVVELDEASKFSSVERDPWAACNVALKPGVYRLALELASGDLLEQTVVASRGWQTQVFLLQRDYEGKDGPDRRADLPGASILLSKNGFVPDDPRKRLVEAAKLGLVNTRQVLPGDVLDRILNGKFENPMLGIFGAHLLLLNKKIRLDLLRIVVHNLRRLLGEHQHPDVEALALRIGKSETPYAFEHPPMLRRSWWQVVDATVDKKGLVPLGSPASLAADRIWGEEPWLQWMTQKGTGASESRMISEAKMSDFGAAEVEPIELQLRQMDYLPGGRVDSESGVPGRARKAAGSKGGRRRGAGGRARGGASGKTSAVAKSQKPGSKSRPSKKELRQIVRSSGLPRANVQLLLDQSERD